MRASKLFWPTLRQNPADADMASHRLLLRAGFIRRLSAGVYSFLPMGWRVLNKISNIIREEMNRVGAEELLLPALTPRELWEASGRWAKWGPDLLRLRDRNERDFCLGPTHEEVITALVAAEVASHRQLPIILYQIQTKFRDELRPRGGLIRCREFLMKDAYSFDLDEQGLERSYKLMEQAYRRTFARCGIQTQQVEADASAMGGTAASEFMMESEAGEDVYFSCPSCGYAASLDKAARAEPPAPTAAADSPPLQRVDTPGMSTVEQVSSFLGVEPWRLIKTLICVADGKPIAALINGDRDLNEAKLLAAVGADSVAMADADTIERVTHAPVGFAGPVGLQGVPIIADYDIRGCADMVTGANEGDAHLVHVSEGRDFTVDRWADLRNDVAGDLCPSCRTVLEQKRAIEIGHIFKLGTFYSRALNATFSSPSGSENLIIMGCYGIGVSRMLAAIPERSHDADGIIWPLSVAPFHAIVLPVNVSDPAQAALAEQVHGLLLEQGVESLLDDRDLGPGPKFKDADLVGIPLQVVVGKTAKAGQVEIRRRGAGRGAGEFVSPQRAAQWASNLVRAEGRGNA